MAIAFHSGRSLLPLTQLAARRMFTISWPEKSRTGYLSIITSFWARSEYHEVVKNSPYCPRPSLATSRDTLSTLP